MKNVSCRKREMCLLQVNFVFCSEYRYASPVDGRQPARVSKMLRLRQDVRIRSQVFNYAVGDVGNLSFSRHFMSENDMSVTWHIRDISSSSPGSVFLLRCQKRVIFRTGSVIKMSQK